MPDPFVSESLLRPRYASCECVDGELVTELESRGRGTRYSSERRYERMEKLHARGMAPVERGISNLVMDKRLPESQFFEARYKSSLLLSCITLFSRFDLG